MNTSEKLLAIKEMNYRLEIHMQAQLRLNNQILAVVRHVTGCSKGEASKLAREAFAGQRQSDTHSECAEQIASLCFELEDARARFEQIRKSYEKELIKLVKELPIAPWIESVRGAGFAIVGRILAHIGDPADYATVSRVWKRMGMAVINGERQARKKDADLAKEHGYSPRRRAIVWNLGECLVKQNDGKYKALYHERKLKEIAKAEAEGLQVVPAAKIPKGKQAEYRSEGHIHARAKRVMEKEFLKDLWIQWQACTAETADRELVEV